MVWKLGENGASMQYALCGLPDSVDFVSLWLCWGNINPAQQADLQEFQKKGSKAVLCWRAGDIGDNLTPGGNGNSRKKMNFGGLILQMKKRILKPQKNMLLQLLILAISIMLMVLIMILKTGDINVK